ncbi:MAG: hypothetical protein PHW18_09680 [Sulfuricurvum sp.]|uniref:hypothetical protein n=1 Tax=Sulfuricurvum sp. TaxID=2025608 RepID=UPI0026365235|nr:hypothetical protein [Sulfuricurvum sp.]MDD2829829.1 hypothetical protein [Sulfuricurvum sp.]MDD4949117.1 hypothetical protein [Sulfuricurvum sp.]
MLKILIDSKNKVLRDLHFSKIKTGLDNLVLTKRNSFHNHTSIEYQILDWIYNNLDDLLVGEIHRLKELIIEFHALLKTFPLLKTEDYDYKKLYVRILKKTCKDNNLACNVSKKKDIQKFILKHKSSIVNVDEILIQQYREYSFDHLNEIFINFYEKEWDKITDYTRYAFVKEHGIKTCPYCNRNYIFVVDSDKKKLRPEIDHFYPKSIYPFLAMSFYNLIPSCQICNHTKKDKDAFQDNLKSPYEITLIDFGFKYIPKNINYYQLKRQKIKENDIEIQLKTGNGVDKNNEYFKLDKLYEQHTDIVIDLLVKKTIYTKSYIRELKENFKFTDDEIYRYLLCNYQKDEDLHKRPLSKLIKDISEELGLV